MALDNIHFLDTRENIFLQVSKKKKKKEPIKSRNRPTGSRVLSGTLPHDKDHADTRWVWVRGWNLPINVTTLFSTKHHQMLMLVNLNYKD